MEYNGINVDITTIVILSVLVYTWNPLLYRNNTKFLIWHKCEQVRQWHSYNEILLIVIRSVNNLLTCLLQVKSFVETGAESSKNGI